MFAALHCCRSRKRKQSMQHLLTISQNNALFLAAQGRLRKRRHAFFRLAETTAQKQRSLPLLPAFKAAYLVPRFFQDNGR
jgi:hypothetical protein